MSEDNLELRKRISQLLDDAAYCINNNMEIPHKYPGEDWREALKQAVERDKIANAVNQGINEEVAGAVVL